jgi:hypothetical protein
LRLVQGIFRTFAAAPWRGGIAAVARKEHFQAKWNHLAARKMRSNKGLERVP